MKVRSCGAGGNEHRLAQVGSELRLHLPLELWLRVQLHIDDIIKVFFFLMGATLYLVFAFQGYCQPQTASLENLVDMLECDFFNLEKDLTHFLKFSFIPK